MKPDLTCSVKVFIGSDPDEHSGALSRGTAALLRGVKDYGSLNKAARSMNMAYSKAWGLVNKLEENFNMAFIVRAGANGSTLTPEGEILLNEYFKIQEEAESLVRKRIEEIDLSAPSKKTRQSELH